jgi:hypothetical protein
MSRKRAVTPLDDARRAELGWRLWWTISHAMMGCRGCLDAVLTEGPLHA